MTLRVRAAAIERREGDGMATLNSLDRRILEAVRAITDEGGQATTATVDERLSDVECRSTSRWND